MRNAVPNRRPIRTHCPYCALQCGMTITGTPGDVAISGDPSFPVNKGVLCIKGWTAAVPLTLGDRLLHPLVRNEHGVLQPVTWDDALTRIARTLRDVQARFGADSVGVFGSGSLTNEKAYLLGKLARVALGTSNIDYNGRFCMSSAAAASNMAFGLDRGLPFPLEDLARAEVVLLAGANLAETMPPILQYLHPADSPGQRVIVVDPRRSATADLADLHLKIIPGTDTAIANGLLHLLVRDGAIDRSYIDSRTEGFERVRAVVATYWPERVERITGVAEARLLEAARLLARTARVMILTGRGPEQQSQGVANALAYINIALALGAVGRPFAGYGCLTGQGNGQGGREHGQKADQLPGYRRLDDARAREHVAAVWGVPPDRLPGPGKSAQEMLASIGMQDGLHALLVLGSNPIVSAPDSGALERRLRTLDLLVVSDFFLSETAALADVVLPSAQWAEEEGTMTNLEGRVLRRRRAFAPPAGVRTDVEMLCALAAALGDTTRFAFDGPEAVFEELGRASRGGPADYSGITYPRLEATGGIFWPCRSEEDPGTARLFADSFPTPSGRARFHAVTHRPPAEEPDAELPLYLTTGRLLEHYQSGTQTRRVDALTRLAPAPAAQLHPATARRIGLAEGDEVTLRTRRGSASFTVSVTSRVREDVVFVPFHWGGERSANRLTNPALDPVSRMPEFKICAVRVERADKGERS